MVGPVKHRKSGVKMVQMNTGLLEASTLYKKYYQLRHIGGR